MLRKETRELALNRRLFVNTTTQLKKVVIFKEEEEHQRICPSPDYHQSVVTAKRDATGVAEET